MRLCIPNQLQDVIITEYHSALGHLGIDKTDEAINAKCYCVNSYKNVTDYANMWVTCQLRSNQKAKPTVQEMDIPPFAWVTCATDVCGPYPTSITGNRYIVTLIDLYSGYPEAIAWPDESA